MARAIWNGTVLAESDTFEVVEGNVYFPRSALRQEHFEQSATRTTCFWKGEASYFTVVVEGERNADAAWYYPAPKDAAKKLENHVAFWKGVTVER